MRRFVAALLLALPAAVLGGEFTPSLVIETGSLVESDLVVRNITDLNARKTCMTFYIRTTGTSPVIICYDVLGQFGARINQVSHIKDKNLVIRKIQDFTNAVACLVAYVSTAGTSPSIYCYTSKPGAGGAIVEDGHLREGDLDVHRVIDPDGLKTCLVSYVNTPGTAPALVCYDTRSGGSGVLQQASQMREGDLIVRKIMDGASGKACLIAYVSTTGTSTSSYCYDN